MNKDIGSKVKKLRTQKKMTLKDLSNETDLSVGFLSQLERGLTSIATDTLAKIADVFDIDISYFFIKPKIAKSQVVRSYDRELLKISTFGCIQYSLSNDLSEKDVYPRLIEILPNNTDEEIQTYVHNGEEFLYVLEGILTMVLGDEHYELYPGDSIHYNSGKNHNWANYTNKMVKLLVVSTPNHFNNK
ncbi:MAG: helix-turn-helix domain-containing protein [Peptostreptococcaceae bacterium]